MKKIKILIVEDEIVIAEDIKYMLEEIGYEVIGIYYSPFLEPLVVFF